MTEREQVFSPSENHWRVNNYRERITQKQLRSMVLNSNDTIIRAGRLCDLKKKSMGTGVYEIWFEARKYE